MFGVNLIQNQTLKTNKNCISVNGYNIWFRFIMGGAEADPHHIFWPVMDCTRSKFNILLWTI